MMHAGSHDSLHDAQTKYMRAVSWDIVYCRRQPVVNNLILVHGRRCSKSLNVYFEFLKVSLDRAD